MPEPEDVHAIADPALVLGISPDASPEQIRQAYLQQVKLHPPDREPEQFERIRDAYEAMRDPTRRIIALLGAGAPEEPFAKRFEGRIDDKPRFVGPEPWLAVIKMGGA